MTDAELLLATEAASGVGGWVFDADTQALRWTPQTFRLHGLQPGAPQPSLEQALAMLVPLDRQRLLDLVASVLARGQRAQAELALVLPGGDVRRLHCEAFAGGALGLARGVHGTLRALDVGRSRPLAMGPRTYEFAVSAAGVGVFEVDVDTGEEVWGDRTLEIYGLPPDAPVPSRQQWREQFLHPDDRARVEARIDDFVAGRTPYELDFRIRRAGDGAVRWLHVRASYAYGGTRYVLGIALDITERQQAEERALDARHALDLSATHVGFGYGWRGVRGDGEWSPHLKAMFGLAPDGPSPTREEFIEMTDPADRGRMRARLLGKRAVNEVNEAEYAIRGPDGRPRVLLTRSVLRGDAAGQPWRYYFVVLDLTETRARDRAAASALERLQMATEASGIGTWEREPELDRVHWDDATCALYGLPPGTPGPTAGEYLALVHPEDRERVGRQLLGISSSSAGMPGDDFEFEFRTRLPDGRVRWLLARGRTHRDADGRMQRRSGICFDITERRQAAAVLQAKELAERANAAKTEFLSRMSHELRTPLNAVLGFAQLLVLDAAHPLTEAQRQRVAHIQNAGWHLLALINDVLDLTRIESRQAQLKPELVPLAAVLDECLAMNAAAAAQRGITLRVPRTEADPAAVWADRTRLKQVLLNLLSNAVKYNRPKGWVELAARAADAGAVSLVVRDGGYGLSTAQVAQLFEPFNRLGREQSSIEGTGIGLSLSKLIAEQMGGRLEVRSQAGVGSEFWFTLPGSP